MNRAEPLERAPHSAADIALADFLATEWSAALRRSPEFASYIGERSGDDRWDDVSPAAMAAEHAGAREALARLLGFERACLSPAARLDFDLYRSRLEHTIRGFELGTELFAGRRGVQTDSTILSVLSFSSASDYDALIARLERWPRKVDQSIELLRMAIGRGLLWPRAAMARVPAQLARLNVAPQAHPFFGPFVSPPAAIGALEAARLRDAAREAIAGAVLPAQEKLRAFVVDEYLPAAPDEAGLCRLAGGDVLYDHFLRINTTTELDADRIHKLGLAEVARIREEMEATAPRTGYTGTLSEIFTSMRSDPANFHRDGAELLAAYRALAKRIDPELVALFEPLPRQPYGVAAMPETIGPDATTAYYMPGSLDGRRAGTMYCNLYTPAARPIYEMPVLTLHEAVPGHHLQFALGAELRALPDFRRAAYYVGYSEGWGLYAESLGAQIGVYDTPKAVLGAQAYDMWRAVRLVVDTGLHARGWTRERAIAYFLDQAPKTELDVINEIDRYITDPGQACAYKIGQLKILELRARAQSALGSEFDIRAFHAVVLGEGSVPLDILAKRIETWLAAATPSGGPPRSAPSSP